MFDFYRNFRSFLNVYRYANQEQLIADLGEKIIRPAELKVLDIQGSNLAHGANSRSISKPPENGDEPQAPTRSADEPRQHAPPRCAQPDRRRLYDACRHQAVIDVSSYRVTRRFMVPIQGDVRQVRLAEQPDRRRPSGKRHRDRSPTGAVGRRGVRMGFWRVDYFGKVPSTLGTVSAADESRNRQGRSGVHITPARRTSGRDEIVVLEKSSDKSPDRSRSRV